MSYPNDPYRLDHTGYGPTGIGNAPTPEEFRRQQMNRFRSDRMAMAWQMMDPSTVGAAAMMTQGVMGQSASPSEARRALFGSASGQAALDMAHLGRKLGFLGHGDPVTLAHNYAQGIAGGGFGMSQGGMVDDRGVSGMGRVTGAGAVSEQVGMNFMRSVNRGLYGSGTLDPSKLHGFNATDASHIFRTLASRGAVGHAAHVQHGADINTRLAAARENAVDPMIKEGLSRIQLSGDSEEERLGSLNKLIDGETNDKLRKEMQAIATSTDAIAINDREADRVSKIIKEVTEGMSSLADIYGDLSAPKLHQKLESVSGMRITNREQASQAKGMVNQLRQAAVVSGMDPRQFMDYSQATQAMMQGQVMQAFGFDQTNASQTKKITAAVHNQMMADSAVQANMQNATVEQARRRGVDMSDAKTIDEIYADKLEGRMQFAERNQGYLMAKGGVDQLKGTEAGTKLEGLLQEYAKTGSMTDPQKQANARDLINSQMKNVFAEMYGGDFGAAMASDFGANALARGFGDPISALEADRASMRERRTAIGLGPQRQILDAMGVGGDNARQVFDRLGSTGMEAMLEISQRAGLQGNPEEIRKAQQARLMSETGAGAEEASELLDMFFDAETGKVKNRELYDQLSSTINSSSHGQMSDFDMGSYSRNKLKSLGADSNREKLSGEQGISIRSIARNLLSGKSEGLGDAESAALAIEALAAENPDRLKKLGIDPSSMATGINFGNMETGEGVGLNQPGIAQLEKILGKDIKLHEKLRGKDGKKFESMSDLIAATQGNTTESNDLLYAAVNMLQTDPEYSGLNLSGKLGSMTAMSDTTMKDLTDSGKLDKWGKKQAGMMQLEKILGLDTNNGEINENLLSNPASMFQAASFDGKLKTNDEGVKVWQEGWNMSNNAAGSLENVMNLSGSILGANQRNLEQLAAADENGDLMGQLQAQYDELAKAKKAGKGEDVMLRYWDKDGEQDPAIEDAMKQLKNAMQKLGDAGAAERGAEIVQELRVTNMIIENPTEVSG